MDEISIVKEIDDLYGEWLEMAGEGREALLISILCKKLVKEREQNMYFKRRLEEYDMRRAQR